MRKHFRRRLARLSVEAIDRNAQFRIERAFPFDHVVLGVSQDAVLRPEKRGESKQLSVVAAEGFQRVVQADVDGRRMQERAQAPPAQVLRERVFKVG